MRDTGDEYLHCDKRPLKRIAEDQVSDQIATEIFNGEAARIANSNGFDFRNEFYRRVAVRETQLRRELQGVS